MITTHLHGIFSLTGTGNKQFTIAGLTPFYIGLCSVGKTFPPLLLILDSAHGIKKIWHLLIEDIPMRADSFQKYGF